MPVPVINFYQGFKRNILCFVLGVLTMCLHGQRLPNPVRRWTVEDGLPSNNLSIVFQDSRKYLWIGTINGLCRFNGREFEQFADDPLLKSSFAGNFVRSITEDEAGRIYILNHESGISRFDYRSPELGFESILPGTAFPKLKGLGLQAYFIKATTTDLFIYYDDTIRRYNLLDKHIELYDPLSCFPEFSGYQFKYLRPVNMTQGNAAGLNVELGAVVFDVESGEIIFRTPEKVNNELKILKGHTRFNIINPYILIFGEFGRYWLFNWKTQSLIADGMLNLPPGIGLLTGGPLSDGTFCYIYERESLFRFDPMRNKTENCRFLLSSQDSLITTYRGFMEVPEGNCYVMTNRGLVLWDFHNAAMENYRLPPASNHQRSNGITVSSFAAIKEFPFLVGSSSGVHLYDEDKNEFFLMQRRGNSRVEDPDSYVFNSGHRVFVQQDGLLEVNLKARELQRLPIHGTTKEVEDFQQSTINTVLQDATNKDTCFWIGTASHGLFKWNTNTQEVRHVSLVNSKGDTATNIRSLVKDNYGRLVVGSQKLGLFFIDPVSEKTFFHIDLDDSQKTGLPPGRLMTLVADNLQQLWIVMQSVGLIKLDFQTSTEPRFNVHGSVDGLNNTILYSGLADDKGNIWIGSESGIEKWDIRYQRFFHYGPEHGIIENQFRYPAWKDGLGRFYFGSTNSFVRFHPDSLQLDTTPPHITLRNIQVNASYRPDLINSNPIILKADEKNIVIRLDVIDFRNPKRTMFRYHVNELGHGEQSWIYSQQSEITLPNLAPGTYEIAYNAANEFGFWSPENAKLILQLPKPWYRSAWFLILCVLAAGMLGYSLYRYRIREFKKVITLRNRISRDLHDDVGSSLGSISIYSEVLKRLEGDKKEEVLNKVGETSREMLEKLNDLVWNINPANDQMDKIETRMRSFAAMILNPLGIQFDLWMDPGLKEAYLEMEKRRNLFLIFKEALHNAAKYSGCEKVTIHLKEDKNKWSMIIEDNGSGFDQSVSRAYNGNGLKSMEERAVAMKAVFTLKSQPGHGTRIEVNQF